MVLRILIQNEKSGLRSSLKRRCCLNHDSSPPYRPPRLGTSEHHGSPTPGLRDPYRLRCAPSLSFFFLRENHWKLRPQLTTSVSPESGPDRCDQDYHCSIVGVKSFLRSKLQHAGGITARCYSLYPLVSLF